jgi:predicted DCC family thiol-disulfide oxidoreductase YuxK
VKSRCHFVSLRISCKNIYTRPLFMYKKNQWPLTLYFDSACPLYAREIETLRPRAAPDRLIFVDMRDAAFDPESLGFTLDLMESSLHARFHDGTWVTGLDATLWSWRAAGLGVWTAPLSWRLIKPLLNVGYLIFCRSRPYLAWLPHPDGSRRCREDTCAVSETRAGPGGEGNRR